MNISTGEIVGSSTVRSHIGAMEAPIHDLHAYSALMVAGIAGLSKSPVDNQLIVDGLLRLGALICDIGGELKQQRQVAFELAISQRAELKSAGRSDQPTKRSAGHAQS